MLLSVRLAGASSASSLSLAISVNGGPPKQSDLPIARGQTSGNVEVTFPNGYPQGGRLLVSVAARDGATTLGERSSTLTLAPSCSTLELDFASDSGSPPDTAGQGTDAGLPDAGVRDGAAAGGGAGGRGGTGVAGAAGGADGAVGGTAGGKPGTGGGSGTGGTGTAGAGGATRDAAADGPCVPRGPEDCYDGVDDDCNGKTDCEDDSCYSVAQCTPIDPALGTLGTSAPANGTCPNDTPVVKTLNSGLVATGCTGCGCALGTATVTCKANLFAFATPTECADSTIAGQPMGTLSSAQSCQAPAGSTAPAAGLRADTFQTIPSGVCAPTGTPSKGSPVWGTTARFCGLPRAGAGCGAGAACVPRSLVATGSCLLMEGAQASCPSGFTRQTRWFTGYVDDRVCSACTCGPPTGGDCNASLIGVTSSCSDTTPLGYLTSGRRLCFADPSATTIPGVQFSGDPVPPSCQPAAPVTGTLTTTGGQTLCCP